MSIKLMVLGGRRGGLKGLVRHKELINEINSPRIPHIQNLYIYLCFFFSHCNIIT